VRAVTSVLFEGNMHSTLRRAFLTVAGLVAFAVLFAPIPAHAVVSGPGSAQVTAGGSTGATMTTDGATIGLAGGHAGISAGPSSGAGPSVRFTFTVGSTVAGGSYGYTFFDDLGGSKSFSLVVAAAPPTTTPPPPPTTTPPPPTITTTTRPEVTTTIVEVPETTTTVPETTTTVATTTTTTTEPPPTTTTTTIPPTTTTSTLVPAGLAAPADDGGGTQIPIALFGVGGAAVLAAVAVGIFLVQRGRPGYGASTPAMVLAWRQFGERRRTSTKRRSKKTRSVGRWWSTAGPVIAYREWAALRQSTKLLRRQIEERNRLRKGR
jgi:hypothetical protein